MLEGKLIDCTSQGFYRRYKIKNSQECPEFLFNQHLSSTNKTFILRCINLKLDITLLDNPEYVKNYFNSDSEYGKMIIEQKGKEEFDKNKIEYKIDDLIKDNVEIENEFIKEIVYGTFTYKDELDKLANKYMKDWTIDRLGFTDIAILRMAIYELIYSDTPDIVVINEAVELAKSYSDDKVVKLINGVLDKIYHEEVNE